MRLSNILKAIRSMQAGAKNKREIQRNTGLSWGSCSEIINTLHEQDVIIPTGLKSINRSQGRRTTNYAFSEEHYLMLGMEISKQQIKCSIANLGKVELSSQTYTLDEPVTATNFFTHVTNKFYHFLNENAFHPGEVISLSLSLPGAVDSEKKQWVKAPQIKSIKNLSLEKISTYIPTLKHIYGVHDIDAGSLSILKVNNWKENNYVFLNCGEGMSASIYQQQLIQGFRGFAGEIGHTPYNNGHIKDECICGKTNCLENILSNRGVLRLINSKFNTNYTLINDVDKKYFRDQDIIHQINDALLHAGLILVNLLDPETLILGGSAIEPFKEEIKSMFNKKLNKQTWMKGPKRIKWYNTTNENSAYGAIIYSLDSIVNVLVEEIQERKTRS